MKSEILTTIFYSNDKAYFYISSDGKIYKIEKVGNQVNVSKRNYLNPSLNDSNVLGINIDKKYFSVKKLVIEKFTKRKLYPGDQIKNIDGDPRNCSLENLQVIPKKKIIIVKTALKVHECATPKDAAKILRIKTAVIEEMLNKFGRYTCNNMEVYYK